MELQPKFKKGEFVKLRHKTNTYIGKALVRYPKGEVLTIYDTFINMSAKDYKEAWDEEGQIVEPVFVCELADADGNRFMVYEDEIKRAKIPIAISPVDDEEEVVFEPMPGAPKSIPFRKGTRAHLTTVK